MGPALPAGSPTEGLRAGFGAFVGLGVAGVFVLSPAVDTRLGLYLIAPFGASAVLLFAVPNSPLAQPWSAIVGNTVAALIGVLACLYLPDPALRIALAVGLTIGAMVLCRAVHPPAGAVAMTAAMNPEAIADLGFRFVLAPVAVGTVLLVVIAAIYAKCTGRHYPFRQFEDPRAQDTPGPAPLERLSLSEAELTEILDRYHLSFNLGVEDLARLVGAAERQNATHQTDLRQTGPLTAADVMSRDLVTVGPHMPLGDIKALFAAHRFTSLPVVDRDTRFLGIIFQIHLLAQGGRGVTLTRLPGRKVPAQAHEIMETAGPRAAPATPVAALLALMSEGGVDAVPVLEQGRLLGIVTRTDLIGALAGRSLQPSPA